MNITPLPVGVEIAGLDLAKPVADHDAAELRRLLAERQLLVFRNQALAPEDQVRVLGIFGNVLDEKQDGKRYQYVSGEKTSIKPGRLLFHSDNHFTQIPLELLSLYGEQVGSKATPTLFADNVAGYRRLSPECQARLEPLTITNRSFFHLGFSDRAAREMSSELTGGPVAHHPAIWRHPETNAPFVYLSELHAYRLEEVSQDESDALLDEVFRVLYDPAYLYEHHWAKGDLVVWNNRTVQHARGVLTEGDDAARSIRRVSTGTATFSEQFEFAPEVIATMKEFYQQSVTEDQ